jgi:hypothetical protein
MAAAPPHFRDLLARESTHRSSEKFDHENQNTAELATSQSIACVRCPVAEQRHPRTTMSEKPKSSRGLKWRARVAGQSLVPAFRILLQRKTLAQLPRLLTEGMGPVQRMFIQAHNTREIIKLLDAGERITFVNSFPRSGNWWIRFLLSDVFQQNQGITTVTGHADQATRIVPDFYCEMVARRDLSIKTPGVLIKSHDDFPTLKQRFSNGGQRRAAFDACRHLCPYRSPEDSLVSMFHVSLRVNYVQSKAGNDIDAFCLEYLPGWLAHITSHLAVAEEGISVFFVSYHDLLQDPEARLSEMLTWLGAAHTPEALERAVANTHFNKVKVLEPNFQLQYKPLLRSGQDGSGNRELKPETLLIIRESTAKLMAQANQHVARQRAKSGQTPAPILESVSA